MNRFSLKALGFAALTTLLALPAVAQTRYCIGGDLDRLSASERASCTAARDEVKVAATRLGAPGDWHFVIVCGEQGWREYTAVAERGEVALEESSADTDLTQRVTYIRESRLHTPEHLELQRVVAHEVAAAQQLTHDETAIAARLAGWHLAPAATGEQVALGTDHAGARPAAHGAGL